MNQTTKRKVPSGRAVLTRTTRKDMHRKYRPISEMRSKKLQSDLDAAARWEANWLMAFHPDKCTVLTITQKKTPFKHDYILHNHILEPVTSAKHLGVTLQSNLKWNTHIDNIT
jgi:myo-inositol-hexaphosphate 3-phosphohydrolase